MLFDFWLSRRIKFQINIYNDNWPIPFYEWPGRILFICIKIRCRISLISTVTLSHKIILVLFSFFSVSDCEWERECVCVSLIVVDAHNNDTFDIFEHLKHHIAFFIWQLHLYFEYNKIGFYFSNYVRSHFLSISLVLILFSFNVPFYHSMCRRLILKGKC